ncbi:MAG: hypothetical protein LBU84_09615 [Prevotella sp.]|nr:hypothetical protein [Prevotella sp.]
MEAVAKALREAEAREKAAREAIEAGRRKEAAEEIRRETARKTKKTICLVLGIVLVIVGIVWAVAAPIKTAVTDGSSKAGDIVTIVDSDRDGVFEPISAIRPHLFLTALIGIIPGIFFITIGIHNRED